MKFPRPSVVKSIPLYAFLLSSVFSTPIEASLFPTVLVDSSTARIPLPGWAMALAVFFSSSA